MKPITHHITDDLLRAYADGWLPQAYSVVVASHISICDQCRAQVEAGDIVGGEVMDGLDGASMSAGARDRMMAALNEAPPPAPPVRGSGIYPAPLVEALGSDKPNWRSMGGGIRQQLLSADDGGTLRLLYIPPGKAVPEHSHRGLELTMVLQGAFEDEEGAFGRGDVETADAEVEHQPIASPGAPCICLAATDAPLRFRGMIPRLLQPILRI